MKYGYCCRAGSDKVSAFQNIGKELGLSCPVKNTYPTILYLARYFHDDFEGGILMNANVGGDFVCFLSTLCFKGIMYIIMKRIILNLVSYRMPL